MELKAKQLKSHPSWVCGLKLAQYQMVENLGVSHPSWVCGLKQFAVEADDVAAGVTPFVGVWIETSTRSLTAMPMAVTPFVGVWIETTSNKKLRTAIKSHTLRGCVD